jgi:hypothetical protein
MESKTSPKQKKGIATAQEPTELEKHKKYESMYGKNEIYWGLGIECESYLELSKPVFVQPGFIMNNHGRERYSVDYYTSYKKDTLLKAFSKFSSVKEEIPLPVLVNSHALTKLDENLEHQTLYKTGSPANPKFKGKTIFDLLKQVKPEYFSEQYEKSFVFDGDSVEIMTQRFYKTTIEKTLEELRTSREEFIQNLKESLCGIKTLKMYCDIGWTSGNHGFAVMVTNPKNLAIFNNGTYHINITLPTQLNEHGKIKNWKKFVEVHKNYIRLIQWLEPILIANFGSPDPLAWLVEGKYSLGSQRCAMSRYIGIGTYDTDTMNRGKLLTMDLSGVRSSWYSMYHEDSAYVRLEKVGLDINFNKHYNHGVEIRFFDWFPEQRLRGLLKFLVYLGDVCLTRPHVENPIDHPVWNQWTARVIQKGAEAGCKEAEAALLSKILGFPCTPCENLERSFADIYSVFGKTFSGGKGPCSNHFLDEHHVQREPATVPVADIPSHSWWRCC